MHNLSNSNYGAFTQCLGKLKFHKTYVEFPQDAIMSHPDHKHVNAIPRSQLVLLEHFPTSQHSPPKEVQNLSINSALRRKTTSILPHNKLADDTTGQATCSVRSHQK